MWKKLISEKNTQRHHELSGQHIGQPVFSIKSLNVLHFPYYQICLNALLGHTTSVFDATRTGGLFNTSSRVALQEAEVGFGTKKCWSCPAPPALQSRQRVEAREWHGGDIDPFAKGSTALISSMGGKKSKHREVDVDQARAPWGQTGGRRSAPGPAVQSGTGMSHHKERGTQVGGWTVSLRACSLPGRVGCQHLEADVGNFISYSMTTSFSSLAFSLLFNFTL